VGASIAVDQLISLVVLIVAMSTQCLQSRSIPSARQESMKHWAAEMFMLISVGPVLGTWTMPEKGVPRRMMIVEACPVVTPFFVLVQSDSFSIVNN
jgi:hypothetical protein